MARTATWRSIKPLNARDGGKRRCVYCGKNHMELSDITVDHVIPRSRGGPNMAANKVLSCRDCNQRKGDRLLYEIGMRINWGVYQADDPQESHQKVLRAIERDQSYNPLKCGNGSCRGYLPTPESKVPTSCSMKTRMLQVTECPLRFRENALDRQKVQP